MGCNLLVYGIYWDYNPLTNPFTNFLGHPSGSTLTFSLRGLVGSPNIPITYCSHPWGMVTSYSIVCGLGFLDRICKKYIHWLMILHQENQVRYWEKYGNIIYMSSSPNISWVAFVLAIVWKKTTKNCVRYLFKDTLLRTQSINALYSFGVVHHTLRSPTRILQGSEIWAAKNIKKTPKNKRFKGA